MMVRRQLVDKKKVEISITTLSDQFSSLMEQEACLRNNAVNAMVHNLDTLRPTALPALCQSILLATPSTLFKPS